MARAPCIDRPCPLSAAAQRDIDGWCGHCNKHVQRLDGMDETQRRAVLRAIKGPVCVSYARRSPASTLAGLALAATLSSGAAMAGPSDLPQPSSALTDQRYTQPHCDEAHEITEMIMVGGVDDPDLVTWVDDGVEVPELPVRFIDTPDD